MKRTSLGKFGQVVLRAVTSPDPFIRQPAVEGLHQSIARSSAVEINQENREPEKSQHGSESATQHPLEEVHTLIPAMRWIADQGESITPTEPEHEAFIAQARRVRTSADELDAAWKKLHEASSVACGDLVKASQMFDALKKEEN